MLYRFTRTRLKAEWLLLVCAAGVILLYTWLGGFNARGQQTGSYAMFAFVYDDYSPGSAAKALEVDVPKGADMRAVYEALRAKTRGERYACILRDAENASFPMLDILAALLVSTLFRKRRMGQFLSAGYSRGQIFLSAALVYFAFAVLLWVIGAHFLLARFGISFAPEERAFFRTTQTAWFCSVLFGASLAFLFAMLLCRPVPAFLAAFGVWILLRRISPPLSISPAVILGPEKAVSSWDPGMDISSLTAGNWIAAAFFAAVLLAAWLRFRKLNVK